MVDRYSNWAPGHFGVPIEKEGRKVLCVATKLLATNNYIVCTIDTKETPILSIKIDRFRWIDLGSKSPTAKRKGEYITTFAMSLMHRWG